MENPFPFTGLTDKEAAEASALSGKNITQGGGSSAWPMIRELVTEPMFLLLLVASTIYFISGELQEGFVLLTAIMLLSAISLFQESRSRKALDALKKFTAAKTKVIRNNEVFETDPVNIVPGDYVIAEEGSIIPADGLVAQSNDFSVDESLLTGESMPVNRESNAPDNQVWQGTSVSSGLAVIRITNTGRGTRLARIGRSINEIAEEKTPLQLQISQFVKRMAIFGLVVFLIMWGYNFYLSGSISESLLRGLTLAMSLLPEEIPVAFTTFMALGAWRLMKAGIVVRQIKTVESLGSATVICLDKTGTITENKMRLTRLYIHASRALIRADDALTADVRDLIRYSMWASEPVPFDPMEKALHEAYSELFPNDERPSSNMICEYPLAGKPPMMTHIFAIGDGSLLIAAKGAPEAILECSRLDDKDKTILQDTWKKLATEGYRVLGVARGIRVPEVWPADQRELGFSFLGFVAFLDPPKKNISNALRQFRDAGIKTKIITGDNALTTSAVMREVDPAFNEQTLDGESLIRMSEQDLMDAVQKVGVFTRMFPEAKLRIINCLKKNGEIVAMTGDGVNDGPALKAAHIGIAMGNRGTELAKNAASLILADDDLEKMTLAISAGRKIYTNLKKAIRYIIAIHIPIILTVAVPLIAGWVYPVLFTPVHIIFLELIMGPTCSIAFENEPPEKKIMQLPPPKAARSFLNWRELQLSILQGLAITAATLSTYHFCVARNESEMITRTAVFVTLIFANIFLTLASRSSSSSLFRSITIKNNLLLVVMLITIGLSFILLYVPAIAGIFRVQPISLELWSISLLFAFVSVIWIDFLKGNPGA